LRRKCGTRSPRADRTARKVQKQSSTVSAGQTDAHGDRERARGNPGEFEPSIGAIRWEVVTASESGIPEPGGSRQVSFRWRAAAAVGWERRATCFGRELVARSGKRRKTLEGNKAHGSNGRFHPAMEGGATDSSVE